MKATVIGEYGYEQSVLGFSLSYNTSLERTKQILPKYAFGIPGESKFLESIYVYIDVVAPRGWWQEADTYRIATKQSESTMHTLTKKILTQENFERPIFACTLIELNNLIDQYKGETDPSKKKELFLDLKNNLPEGFLQRRIWTLSYKTLQNVYNQRLGHRLPYWRQMLEKIVKEIQHPEFIIKEN